jgi:hypothetical protein
MPSSLLNEITAELISPQTWGSLGKATIKLESGVANLFVEFSMASQMLFKMAMPVGLTLTEYGDAASLTDGNSQDTKSFGVQFPDLAKLSYPSGTNYTGQLSLGDLA